MSFISVFLKAYRLNVKCSKKQVYSQAARRNPLDKGCKLNVHKMSRGCPGRLQNVLCTFSLRPMSRGNHMSLKGS